MEHQAPRTLRRHPHPAEPGRAQAPSSTAAYTFIDVDGIDRSSLITLREWLVFAFASLALSAAPWMIGSRPLWAQITLAVLAGLAFACLLIPMGRLSMTVRETLLSALRFPAFFPGLLFLLFVLIQALNPAFDYHVTPRGIHRFAMEPRPDGSFIPWLPMGFTSGTEPFHPWRALMVHATSFFLSIAIWAGIRGPKLQVAMLWIVASNGLLVAVLAIAQSLTKTNKIFWTIPSDSIIAGPFTYTNFCGGYLYMVLAVAGALGLYYLSNSKRSLLKSLPFPLFVLFVLCIFGGIVTTASRASGALGFGLMAFFFLIVVIKSFVTHLRTLLIFLCGSLLLGVFLALTYPYMKQHTERLLDRYGYTGSLDTYLESLSQTQALRIGIHEASWDMFRDSPVVGWGGYGYYYFIPEYIYRKEEIRYSNRYKPWIPGKELKPYEWRYRTWTVTHAHSSYLDFLTEYGLVGTALSGLGCALLMLVPLVRFPRMRLYSLALMAGCGALLVHSFGESMFLNSAIYLTFTGILTLNSTLALRGCSAGKRLMRIFPGAGIHSESRKNGQLQNIPPATA